MRDISVSEWLTELTKATKATHDGAVTVVELSQQMGRSVNGVRAWLKRLSAQGEITLSPVQVRRPAMDGRDLPIAGYRITRKKPAK
jgi:predicted ArsR family transcriptional regulator